MQTVEDFLKQHCTYKKKNYQFETDFEKIIFDFEDSIFQKNTYLSVENTVRFFNKTFNFKNLLLDEFTDSDFEDFQNFGNNFTEILEEILDIEEEEEEEEESIPIQYKVIFFIPSYWDTKVVNIIKSNYRHVESCLKEFIPEEIISKLDIKFKDFIKKEIEFDKRGKRSISLFKFYNGEVACTLEETILAVNDVKNKVNAWCLDSFYLFGIGSIPKGKGIVEKAIYEKCNDPRAFHFNFWKLNNLCTYSNIAEFFEIYNFEVEN